MGECVLDGCGNKNNSARGLCRKHYNEATAREGKKRHRLTRVDPEGRTAHCHVCGPTKIWPTGHRTAKGEPRWQCEARYHERFGMPSRKNNEDPVALRRYYVKSRYGITVEESEKMLADQDGKCAICDAQLSYADQTACIDHCHATGRVRGILCQHCNRGLGAFRDDPHILRQAADYAELEGVVWLQ